MVAQTDPVAPPKDVEVKLFRSWHNGFGDADEVHFNHRMEAYASTEAVTTRYNRVHGSVDARRPGQVRMGMQVKRMAQTNHDLTPVFGIEWTDTNGIYPAIFYLVGTAVKKVMFGGATTAATLAANATGGMFDDDGSGVPYLYACFGATAGGGGTKIQRMNRAQTVTQSADVVADLMLSLNGKAYRTITPTAGTVPCQVSVCPYGKDRFVLANWLAGVTVGFAGTKINVLTVVRQAPIAIKPEGVFAYSADLDQWVNYALSWRTHMHLNNGIGAFFLGDRLVIPMGDGGAMVFDGNNLLPFDPGGLDGTPNLHTTKTKFTSMSALRHWIVGATPSDAKQISAGNSMLFLYTTDDVSFTDASAAVRDVDLTTKATLPSSAGLKVYIGWTHPFVNMRFDTGLANTNAATVTAKVGTAPATYSAVSVVDFTSLAGATLGQSGNITMLVDPVDTTGWVQTTVNGITAYWVQLSFSGALTANITWLNCLIQPWYPSIDKTNFPLDGLDKSGVLPHILFGRGDQTVGPAGTAVWHDMVSLSRPDDIGPIIFGDVGGTGMNRSRHMIAIGRFNVWEILTADDDMPQREPVPVLNDVGLIEGPSIVPQHGFLVRLKQVKIDGHGFDPAWKFFFYHSWDSGKTWSSGSTELQVPILQDFNDPNDRGYRFRWAMGWKGTAGEALDSPCVTEVTAKFEILNIPIDSTQSRALQTKTRF